MAAAPSITITVDTPDGVLTFTPGRTTPLARLYAQTAVEPQLIQEAIDTYLQALIARHATDIDFALENAAIMLGASMDPNIIAHTLNTILMYRRGQTPSINEEILTIDSPLELIEELIRELQALGPVPKPVPVPPPYDEEMEEEEEEE